MSTTAPVHFNQSSCIADRNCSKIDIVPLTAPTVYSITLTLFVTNNRNITYPEFDLNFICTNETIVYDYSNFNSSSPP